MIGIQQLLVVAANTPAETPVVVDVAGNGVALMPVVSVEIKDGKLVIACRQTGAGGADNAKTPKSPKVKSPAPAEPVTPAEPAAAAPVAPAAEPSNPEGMKLE